MLYDKRHNKMPLAFVLTHALLSISEAKLRRFFNTMAFKIQLKKYLLMRRWAREKLTEMVWLWRMKVRTLTLRE